MLTVSANDVMKLRSETNAPMMDCKQALADASGDFDAAKVFLRERLGALDVTKKDSGTEGLIAIDILNEADSVTYAIVEIGTETDFNSRSPLLVGGAFTIASAIVYSKEYDSVIDRLRVSTGENISLRRADSGRMEGSPDCKFQAGSYVHHDRKSAAYVIFAVAANSEPLTDEMMKNIAMHVVASTPIPVCVRAEDVPEDIVAAERSFFKTKAEQSGKPPAIQEKIVEGGLSKFRASRALIEQPYIRDPSKKVKDILPKGVSIVEFDRWEVGR